MSRIQMLRGLVNERLAAAAEEIFGVFERTIEDYVEEIDRWRKLLDVLQPETRVHIRDHLQLLVCEDEVPPEQHQQQRSLSRGHEDPEPLQFKEEQEELWTSQGGEQLQELEEADILKFTFTPVSMKKENDEEKPQTSQLHQTQTEEVRVRAPRPSTSTEHMKTEPGGEVCGVSEPDSNLDPAVDTEQIPAGQFRSSDCYSYRTETEDRDAWKETREPQSGSNRWRSKKMQKVKGQSSISDKFQISVELPPELKSPNQTAASHSCKVCSKSFSNKRSLMAHVKFHPRSCGLCGKHLEQTESLKLHFNVHRKCQVCGKEFPCFKGLERHERIHTGEKPFSCTVCGKGFGQNQHLQIHMRIHTGEKPFSCTVCGERFSRNETLQSHMTIHTGKKPFSCMLCGKGCVRNEILQNHMRTHTGERPFSCTVCGNRFGEKRTLKIHMRIHTGAKPYSCGVCGEKFRHVSSLNKHRCHNAQ